MKKFDSVLEFLKILNTLSISKDKNYLSSESFISIIEDLKGDRVNKMYSYILSHFTDSSLRTPVLAQESNMSASTFGHFFKKRK